MNALAEMEMSLIKKFSTVWHLVVYRTHIVEMNGFVAMTKKAKQLQ